MIRIECQAQLIVRDSNGQTSSLSDAVPLLSLVDTCETGRPHGDDGSGSEVWGAIRLPD